MLTQDERRRPKMKVHLAYRRWFWKAIFRTVFFLFLAMAFGACREENKVMKDPNGSLEKEAEAYWKMRLLERNYEGTYAMEADQGTMTLKEYEKHIPNKGQINYVSIAAGKAEVDGANGTVEISVTYLLPNLAKEVSSSIVDQWVIKDNKWKHLLNKKPESQADK